MHFGFKFRIFYERLSLLNVTAKSLLFKKSSIFEIHFEASRIMHLDFLNVHTLDSLPLTHKNFYNKESVRIIKYHFEKQNNITESNKYFKIEQELYMKQLIDKNHDHTRIATLITLYFNKFVSNFGTDWFRPLFLILFMGYLVLWWYPSLSPEYLDLAIHKEIKTLLTTDRSNLALLILGSALLYFSTFINLESKPFLKILLFWSGILFLVVIPYFIFKNNLYLKYHNIFVQIMNPASIFKGNELFKGIESYGSIIRLSVVFIGYQFIMAFRQNTRRK